MDEKTSIYANTNDPYLRLNGIWYRRINGPGWTRIAPENAPPAYSWAPLQRKQWAVFRSTFVELNLLDNSATDAIEKGLPEEPPTKAKPDPA
ncbi:hypothetical protein [Spirosoma endbachense]|uniref:Uncharacterized protein n=1 Tax=Spirosoma endbachense TaxID=2666025 RepID=A0A6P1W694_9BACT|nr:hypothetical protein [Spirosoma endbachense]QHV99246.1 hypothetical protein GJR95_31405 [Spirosoma endbachense]